MKNVKAKKIALGLALAIAVPLSSFAELSDREKDQEMYSEFEPHNLETYGYVLPIGSKVTEVHQLANDLQHYFFTYKDKTRYEEIAAEITRLDPSYPSAYLMQSFYVPDDTPEYTALVSKAYELAKKHPLESERNMVAGDYHLLITKDYEKALAKFQRVADLYPESAIAIWCVGMVHYYAGNDELALKAYKKSVEINPDLAKGYESIAWIYSSKQTKSIYDPSMALKYLELAIAKGANAKNDQYYAAPEVYIYYINGMYDKAISKVELYNSYGEKYSNSETLQNVLKWSKEKLLEKSTNTAV